MTNKTKHDGKKCFCRYFLQLFSSLKVSKCHLKHYLSISHNTLTLMYVLRGEFE